MRDAGSHPTARKVTIGHSMGCCGDARRAHRSHWDLLIAFEPAPNIRWARPARRVLRRAICFRSN
jgi:hypothetical protein